MLNFLGIGATKAGTTSFHYYLSKHPKLCLPIQKEVHFFDEPDLIEKGWDSFEDEVFSHKKEGQVMGKISPRYLRDPETPKNIKNIAPDLKLFVLLRNPIDRCFSHYRMHRRLGKITMDFSQAIDCVVNTDTSDNEETSLVKSIFSQSEYGKLLSEYLKYFDRSQILTLFTEDLEREPQKVLEKFYSFIGVEHFIPNNISKKYFEGGDSVKYHNLILRLKKLRIVSFFWSVIGKKSKRKLINWYYYNIKSSTKKVLKLSVTERNRLAEYFREDVKVLSEEFDLTVPWKEFTQAKINKL